MSYKVSVVVPNWNETDCLDACIESLWCQSYPVHEIIIVDDGSDQPPDPKKFCSSHTKLICQSHRGFGAALNTGIRQMTGDVFCLLPSDDEWESNKLERQALFAKEHPSCILHSYVHLASWTTLSHGLVNEYSDEEFAKVIRHSSPYFANTFWIPKPILDQVGMFREDVEASEDYDWVLRSVLIHGIRYRLQKEVLTEKSIWNPSTSARCKDRIPELMKQFNQEVDQWLTQNTSGCSRSTLPTGATENAPTAQG